MAVGTVKSLTLKLVPLKAVPVVVPVAFFGVTEPSPLDRAIGSMPRKINLSHLALGLMVSIACLPIFGADRPMFWRESASGVRVSAFFLARVTVTRLAKLPLTNLLQNHCLFMANCLIILRFPEEECQFHVGDSL